MANTLAVARDERDARAQPYEALASVTDRSRPAAVLLPGPVQPASSVLDRFTVDTATRTGTVYAVSTGNRDLDLVGHYQAHAPYRVVACAYDAQAPLGSHQFPDDVPATQALVTGEGARAQRLHVERSPTGLTLQVVVQPDAGEAAAAETLEVAAGEFRASAPLQPVGVWPNRRPSP